MKAFIYGLASAVAIIGIMYIYIGEITNGIMSYGLSVLLLIYAEVYGIRLSETKRGEQ